MADTRRAEAVDILARRKAADDILYGHQLDARDSTRKLPADARAEVKARLGEIQEQLRPSNLDFEMAYDVLVHGTETADV